MGREVQRWGVTTEKTLALPGPPSGFSQWWDPDRVLPEGLKGQAEITSTWTWVQKATESSVSITCAEWESQEGAFKMEQLSYLCCLQAAAPLEVYYRNDSSLDGIRRARAMEPQTHLTKERASAALARASTCASRSSPAPSSLSRQGDEPEPVVWCNPIRHLWIVASQNRNGSNPQHLCLVSWIHPMIPGLGLGCLSWAIFAFVFSKELRVASMVPASLFSLTTTL